MHVAPDSTTPRHTTRLVLRGKVGERGADRSAGLLLCLGSLTLNDHRCRLRTPRRRLGNESPRPERRSPRRRSADPPPAPDCTIHPECPARRAPVRRRAWSARVTRVLLDLVVNAPLIANKLPPRSAAGTRSDSPRASRGCSRPLLTRRIRAQRVPGQYKRRAARSHCRSPPRERLRASRNQARRRMTVAGLDRTEDSIAEQSQALRRPGARAQLERAEVPVWRPSARAVPVERPPPARWTRSFPAAGAA